MTSDENGGPEVTPDAIRLENDEIVLHIRATLRSEIV